MLERLVRAGMDVARLNFSHGTLDERTEDLAAIRDVSRRVGKPVGILQDLAGPKVRTGALAGGPVVLEPAAAFVLTAREVPGDVREVSVTYGDLPRDVQSGDTLLLSDGAIELLVENITGADICCRVVVGGPLGAHKGINLPSRSLRVPFFTAKERGRGTGLGLSTVYGIIRQFGGHIGVHSEEGHGSAFKIYLPRADALAESVGLEPPSAGSTGGHETILMVEDEATVRDLLRKALQDRGYTILECSDGVEAMETAATYSEPIHLLLTDVVLPGANGKDVAERLVSIYPELKVLFISGYTDEAVAQRGVLEGGWAFIQKPVKLATLARKVREVLDGQPDEEDES